MKVKKSHQKYARYNTGNKALLVQPKDIEVLQSIESIVPIERILGSYRQKSQRIRVISTLLMACEKSSRTFYKPLNWLSNHFH